MENQPSDPTPPELQVAMDVEITVAGLASSPNQPKLQAALSAVPGVESVSFHETSVAIRYDPQRVTKAALCEAIGRAGFQVSDAETAPAAPPIESP